ncbi:MAG TPA: helix-turn-helix domain-containing protein, partial [Candidatus Caenarcaniphilales bacterium]
EALLEVKTAPGKAAKIPPQVMKRLQERLAKPQGFKSYGQIQQWLLHECNVDVAYQTVHAYVRYKLKGKPKVPRPRSKAAKPAAQAAFKKTLVPSCG